MCALVDINRAYIHTSDHTIIAFHFVQRPKYFDPSDRLLFREGSTKGLGIVKSVGYDPAHLPDDVVSVLVNNEGHMQHLVVRRAGWKELHVYVAVFPLPK